MSVFGLENIFENASITTILDLDTELKITSFNIGGIEIVLNSESKSYKNDP